MGGDQHDVALVGRHLPQVDGLGNVGGVVHVPLREPAGAVAVGLDHLHGDAPGALGHGQVPPVPLPVADAGADGLAVLVVEGVAALVRGDHPFPVDDAHGHVAGPVDAAGGALLQVHAGFEVVVGEAGGVVAEALPIQGAFAVQRGIGGGSGGRQRRQQEQHRQDKPQKFFAHGHIPSV